MVVEALVGGRSDGVDGRGRLRAKISELEGYGVEKDRLIKESAASLSAAEAALMTLKGRCEARETELSVCSKALQSYMQSWKEKQADLERVCA